MKQLLKTGVFLGAVFLLTGCAEENVEKSISETAKDYQVMFEIRLPASSTTRSISENSFEDGTDQESAIHNAIFYIFKGNANQAESDYTFITKSNVYYPQTSTGSTDIEKTAVVTVNLREVDKSSSDLYGLAILNSVDNQGNIKFTEPKINQTFEKWSQTVMDGGTELYILDSGSSFVMTNAPTFESISNEKASGISTLVKLDTNEFSEGITTPSNIAGTFYVQRGVAKVDIKPGQYKNSQIELSSVPSIVNSSHHFNLTDWNLSCTNKKSFPVQVVEGLSFDKKWHYIEKKSNIDFNHLYWAKDPNYTQGWASGATLSDHFANTTAVDTNIENALYCLENTMDYSEMKQGQTTCAVFKGKYSLDGTTYKSFVVNPVTGVAVAVEGYEIEGVNAGSHKLSEVVNNENISSIATSLGITQDDIVDFYPDGVTYYVARIKHFDPSLETPLPSNYNGIDSYTNNELGRYGVLRNNIYRMLITNVTGYGYPTIPVPEKPEDPDDELEEKAYNIKVDIKVLKWTVRGYEYEL